MNAEVKCARNPKYQVNETLNGAIDGVPFSGFKPFSRTWSLPSCNGIKKLPLIYNP
jgi:hypothetical protein